MRIASIGDPDIIWPKGFKSPASEFLPFWQNFDVCELRSPCHGRYFFTTCVPPFGTGKDDTLENIIFYSMRIEFDPDDVIITEMCEGGGRTWVDLFLNWDLVLVSFGTLFGERKSILTSPKPYEKYITQEFGHYGNTGAWELYRQWATNVRDDSYQFETADSRKRRQGVWQKYVDDFKKRYPDRGVA